MSALTPSCSTSKRELSASSTPSPLSTNTQPTKKVKMPSTDTESDLLDIAAMNPNIEFIIKSVAEKLDDQFKITICDQVNTSVKAMAQSVADIINESLNERISTIELENKHLHEKVQQLTDRVEHLEMQQQAFDVKLDVAEQYSRRSCLRVSGIPETPDESTDHIILEIARSCNVDLDMRDIDRSHRLRPKRSPSTSNKSQTSDIIVKFVSYRARASFFRGKSGLKNSTTYKGVNINEDLTRHRAELLRKARILVKSGSILGAWSYDGRIFIKRSDGSKTVINSQKDLTDLH